MRFTDSCQHRAQTRLLHMGAVLASLLWLASCGGGSGATDPTASVSSVAEVIEDVEDDDTSAVTVEASRMRILAASTTTAAAPFSGGPGAHVEGAFGPLHDWPVMPIHMVLLPDGRILAYGTDTTGKQGATLHYAVWDPALGTGADAFMVLPNWVGTDIFCGGQVLLPGSGKVLLVGGDARVNGVRNYATNDVNLFDPTRNVLEPAASPMAFNRWYATAVTQPNGEQLVLGGRNDKNFPGNAFAPATSASYISTPEVRQSDGTWRTLGALSDDFAYGAFGLSWFYPRAWVKPDGKTFIMVQNGRTYTLNPAGTGTLLRHATNVPRGTNSLPSVMFAPGKVLSLREDKKAIVVDINGPGEPVVSAAGEVSAKRYWGNATVLADGKVWVSGGSAVTNELEGVAQHSEMWNPATGDWRRTASAARPRLYHSAAILLRDGTVATGGGGAPGPYRLLDGEIYYPPYLFKRDGSGELTTRPRIMQSPDTALTWNQPFSVKVIGGITRATLVRNGSVTHAFNNDTRFFELEPTQVDNIVTLRTPESANVAPPGYYMLFVWNKWGVPSVAAVLKIG